MFEYAVRILAAKIDELKHYDTCQNCRQSSKILELQKGIQVLRDGVGFEIKTSNTPGEVKYIRYKDL